MQPDKRVVCIYCYHDGYPNHLGRILANHYDTPKKIERLMRGGHLSGIEERLELCSYDHKGGEPLPAKCRPVALRNLGAFIKRVREYGHDYGYVFQDGRWHIYKSPGPLIPLEL